jgi:small multidrug resistance pump
MPALMLALAIMVEIVATTLLKYSQGFTRVVPSSLSIAGYILSLYLLSLALVRIPVSTAYAIWSGAGTAVVAAIGWLFLGEAMGALKATAIGLIVVGVVMLNLTGAE